MAYNGYLLQIGDYRITGSKLIEFATYEVSRKVQDLEPFRDATGALHRNSLPHVPLTVEFQLKGGLSNTQLGEFFGNIQRNYINALERKEVVILGKKIIKDFVRLPVRQLFQF
jgi:hypothetical protein